MREVFRSLGQESGLLSIPTVWWKSSARRRLQSEAASDDSAGELRISGRSGRQGFQDFSIIRTTNPDNYGVNVKEYFV